MIFKGKGLSDKNVKNISSSGKKALAISIATGAVFIAAVAAARTLPYAINSQTKNVDPSNDKHFSYVVDENTDVVYIKYKKGIDLYRESGLSVAMMIDEKTGETRVMTSSDLDKIIEADKEIER